MTCKRTRVALLAVGVFALPIHAGTSQERARRIEDSVLAPCCYTEPVSRHQSEIAVKMRLEIGKAVLAGKTDQEILGEYVNRYGSKILVNPSTRPAPWTIWVPWLALAAGSVLVVLVLKHLRSKGASMPSPAAALSSLPDVNDE